MEDFADGHGVLLKQYDKAPAECWDDECWGTRIHAVGVPQRLPCCKNIMCKWRNVSFATAFIDELCNISPPRRVEKKVWLLIYLRLKRCLKHFIERRKWPQRYCIFSTSTGACSVLSCILMCYNNLDGICRRLNSWLTITKALHNITVCFLLFN